MPMPRKGSRRVEDAAPYLGREGKPQLLRKNGRVAEIAHCRACLSPLNRERKKLLPHGTDFAFPSLFITPVRLRSGPTNKTNQKNIMKKIIALIASALLAAPLAMAQVETGTSAGAEALDQARSGAISAGRTTAETVTVTDYKTASGKEVVVVAEEDKWWSVNASTGWDSLYMYRGANVLGNGNGIYWMGAGLGIVPWENGSLNTTFWYGVGSWWNNANQQMRYGEINVGASYTHTIGNLALTAGWLYYYYPNQRPTGGVSGPGNSQNEIYFGAAYDIEIGGITITPNTTYYYNVGPELGTYGGFANGGSSYWILGLSSEIPLAYDGAVSLAPYTQFGINFGLNNRVVGTPRFNGGNNWQTGIAMPIQLTSWFSVSPYIAYSYQWQNLYAGLGSGGIGGLNKTAVNTFWGGISANFSF
jgi:hypothetical protein